MQRVLPAESTASAGLPTFAERQQKHEGALCPSQGLDKVAIPTTAASTRQHGGTTATAGLPAGQVLCR